MKIVTIADVAKEASVSKSTVSQYLNKRYEYMSHTTKKRIQEAIEKLGYRPNIVARSLKQKSTTTIGVIVANILHSFSTQVIRAIEDLCHEHDFHVIVCNADDDPMKERKYMEMLLDKQVDGMIIFPTGGNVDLFKSLKKRDYPIIFVDRYIKNVKIPSVILDNKMAASLAVKHFLEKGYSQIAIMTPTIKRKITPRLERIEGYKAALEMNQLPIIDTYIKSMELEQFETGIEELLSLNNPPQAILAANDLTLFEILKYMKKGRLTIPDDLALISIDDVSFASLYTPRLTAVTQPALEMGKKAAQLLLEKIRDDDSDEEGQLCYRFEPKLIERDSC